MKNKKIDSTLQNFEWALNRMREFLSKPIEDDRDEAGVIQSFEFTFELSWKTLQKIGEERGVPIGSPRSAFEFALKEAVISSEEEPAWIQMLKDRNITTHAYDQKIAHGIFDRIKNQHYKNLSQLLERLKGLGKA